MVRERIFVRAMSRKQISTSVWMVQQFSEVYKKAGMDIYGKIGEWQNLGQRARLKVAHHEGRIV